MSPTYGLRVLAAGTAISVCASILIGSRLSGGQLGNVIFSQLYLAFSYAVWVLVPLLTADCVSRERREGTLGLLFLTPLKVPDVVDSEISCRIGRDRMWPGSLSTVGH